MIAVPFGLAVEKRIMGLMRAKSTATPSPAIAASA